MHELTSLVNVVDKRCYNYLQKVRVIQASLVEARMKSTLFVGEELDGLGRYNISAQEQPDGSAA